MFDPSVLTEEIDRHASICSSLVKSFSYVRDHVGYRCASPESYESKVGSLRRANDVDFIREILVAARRIAVFVLPESICGFQAFAVREARPDESPFEGVEHLGYVVSDIEQVSDLMNAEDSVQAQTVKTVGISRYLKCHGHGIEIEFREFPILDG